MINHGTSSNLYWAYYPHRSRELVSPVCGIFNVTYLGPNYFFIHTKFLDYVKYERFSFHYLQQQIAPRPNCARPCHQGHCHVSEDQIGHLARRRRRMRRCPFKWGPNWPVSQKWTVYLHKRSRDIPTSATVTTVWLGMSYLLVMRAIYPAWGLLLCKEIVKKKFALEFQILFSKMWNMLPKVNGIINRDLN